jgi:chorismate mutase/prephenate dehydratase
VFTEVAKKSADYGVVPVENSTEGVVTHTLGHVRGQRFERSCRRSLLKIPAVPDEQFAARENQEALRPSAVARAMPWLAREKSAARGNRGNVIQCALRRTRGEGKDIPRALGGVLAAEKYGLKILAQDIPGQFA